MENAAYTYLSKDPLHHAGMLETLRLGRGALLSAGEDHALIAQRNKLFLSAETGNAARPLLPYFEKAEVVALHQDFLLDPLKEAYGLVPAMAPCVEVSYQKKTPLPLTLPKGVEIRLLDQSDTDFVFTHYSHAMGRDYIAARIGAGMLGVFVDGERAGFMGTHDEGAMGILEVLPAFRRRGLATLMEIALINWELSLGHLPYGDVAADNEASLTLQRKLGMSVSRGLIYWLEKSPA